MRGAVFSVSASGPCAGGWAGVSSAARAPAAIAGGADLVVVEGGLNDYDQPRAAIRSGFRQLMRELRGYAVVVVGPAGAPSRADAVPRVDALLGRLSARYDVPYVSTTGLELAYLPDRLHLTASGHDAFGDHVADRLARLGLG